MLITDIINILGNEFSSIYCVNRQDQYIQIYRHLNENTELDELMNEKKTYETVIQKYIETNVFEEDRKLHIYSGASCIGQGLGWLLRILIIYANNCNWSHSSQYITG